jgi:alcohol dehydrogenase class IV
MTNKFLFSTTKNILCEVGSSKAIGGLFKGLGCRQGQTILFVTDKGLYDAKLAEKAMQDVIKQGYKCEVYSGVVADPPESKINEAVDISKRLSVAGVVGFGGGSSMDVAKLVAYLGHSNCQQSIRDIYGVGMCSGGRLPLIQIPTTAGKS